MTDARDTFTDLYGFPLDDFQRRAIDALERGSSVLVAAPTGAGKTVVGEFACHAAVTEGGKCFYTTPIKALSNQKHRDLIARYGEDRVGLLTGDRSINGEAPVVVMTTEVLRNMIYEASPTLDGLRFVVLDEVHYLADRARGAVWEEVIVQLPLSVQLACLSATVSNAEEFGDWLDEVRSPSDRREGIPEVPGGLDGPAEPDVVGCEVVIEERRPVPLRHWYYVNDRVYPTFRAGKKKGASREHRERAAQALAGVPNPDVVMLERNANRSTRVTRRGRHVRSGPRLRWPSRPTVVHELRQRGWLPAIFFVFSRQGCENAVDELVSAGVRLTNRQERDEIAAIVDTIVADVDPADLRALGFEAWRSRLLDGLAAHHAGMVPAFKEAVEACFQRGLLKVVIATETLALGINMPAKTVVIERLEKWNGETHVMLTPGEYTQLTGRAGRRGIDKVGNAIVLYQRDIDFQTVAGLVGTRTYPLGSSFAPSYNMAVNLLRRHDLPQAEALLGASFAQFQADRSVSTQEHKLAELEAGMRGYAQHLQSDVGDWPEYWALRRELSRIEKAEAKQRRRRREQWLEDGLRSLQPGDVLYLPWLGHRGMAAVVGLRVTRKGAALAEVVTDDKAFTKLGARELDAPPAVVDRITLPNAGNPRQSSYRDSIAYKLRGIQPPQEAQWQEDPEARAGPAVHVEELRAAMKAHPCHRDPNREEIEVWQHRYDDLLDRSEKLRHTIERRTGSLVRRLHRILGVLTELGYVDEQPAPTEQGRTLARIYSEVDLLVAESLRRGLLDDLTPGEVAGAAALFLYEARGPEPPEHRDIPTARLVEFVEEVLDLADELRSLERTADLEPLRELDPAFVGAAYRWANGHHVDSALRSLDMTGGDFVRNVKQIADLLGQLRDVGEPSLSRAANEAMNGVRRGIVEA